MRMRARECATVTLGAMLLAACEPTQLYTGARTVVGVNAVGGIRADMGPRAIVVPDQLIDYTHGRYTSFCDTDGAEVKHIDFSEPYTALLRHRLLPWLPDVAGA